jgi:hypothetical protein
MSYRIVRSPRIPFDFATVTVTVPNLFSLATNLLDLPRGARELEDESVLRTRAEETLRRVADKAASQPNWRVWRLKNGQTTWGEYGGSTFGGRSILLRLPDGRIDQLERFQIEDEGDRALVERGRRWYDSTGQPMFCGELEAALNYGLRFHNVETGKLEIYAESEFAKVDQELLRRLRELLGSKAPAKRR